MSDINLDTPSFGIVDTIISSSQELVDSFLDNDGTATSSPDEIEDINTPKEQPKKQEAKKVPAKDTKETSNEEEKAFDLEDIFEDGQEEDKEEEKKEEVVNDQSDTADEDFNQFEAFSKELYNLGAFTADEDEEPTLPKTPQEFLDTFNEQAGKKAQTVVDNFIGRFGEEYQEAFDAIFVKGVSPKEYLQTYEQIQNFAEMDLAQEANQITVARETFKNLDYDEEDINTEIEKLKNYGDLEDFAKKSHKGLVKKEAAKLNEIVAKQEGIRAQQAEVKKQFVTNVNNTLQEKLKTKEFDGIPINPKLAQEVQDMLLSEKWKNTAGEALTDFDVEILNLKRPENHGTKVKIALLLKILKQDPTLSTIQKSGVTKQTNKLFSEVVRNKPKTATATKTGSTHWTNL